MNKRRKKIIIFIIIFLIILIRIYIANNRHYAIKDIERDVNIIDFESNAQLDNPPTEDKYGHDIGNGVIIAINNRGEFLDKVDNLDYGLSVINGLNESMKYLNMISELKEVEIEDYYYSNKEVIDILYGIKDIEKFEKFFDDLNNKKYVSCEINLDTLEVNNNVFTFTIELESDSNITIPIKALAKDNDDMIARLYFYN